MTLRLLGLAVLLCGCSVHMSSSPPPTTAAAKPAKAQPTKTKPKAQAKPTRANPPKTQGKPTRANPAKPTMTKGMSVAAKPIDWSLLPGEWHLDRASSSDGVERFVPTSVELGASRFRPKMAFESSGTVRVLTMGATDRHGMTEGTWTRKGSTLTVRYTHPKRKEAITRIYTVEGLTAKALDLRPQS